eukprot:CAMPEP_0178909066 /NCGR_PEP_ID=MMETSP0786-20121207/8282_1 /TAXON_ID=186022 /ORGANISM="Thalassionema frauenfeldii, Strain CCMP 1798" /LENGTH=431 /DNA_ID=CAMNT_0020581059 /DNA_START=32 /DNA_END=1327 /DNA_ORIENTATION=-
MPELEEVPTAPWWEWLGLSAIACASFWCQATVTEDRLVPALNVIAHYYNIPDDIAGATLMAAGASSPELFSSFVALFVTHSSLGLGTIVGSEIFNQLVICAGAVYSSKTGKLELDRAILIREVGFYGLSIILLYISLQDVEPIDDDTLNNHIYVSFWEACMLVAGYILYVIVCANMNDIVDFFSSFTSSRENPAMRPTGPEYGAIVELEQGEEEQAGHNLESHVDLMIFPSNTSKLNIIFWLSLLPLRFLLQYTVPDVLKVDRDGDSKSAVRFAYFSTFMCLVWLIIGSYAMVASLERLAELMDIPDAVIGFTVSAAGTSLPNYIASKIAAEKGFGNQAVSNAFGSNTFNIMVGLGLPWMLYTSFGTGFKPYHGLPAEGILESILILAVVLLVFVVLMIFTGCVVYKWHGNLFLILYCCYIAFAIGQVYLG